MSQQLQADTEPGGSTSRAGSPEGFLLPPGESNSQQRGSSLLCSRCRGPPGHRVHGSCQGALISHMTPGARPGLCWEGGRERHRSSLAEPQTLLPLPAPWHASEGDAPTPPSPPAPSKLLGRGHAERVAKPWGPREGHSRRGAAAGPPSRSAVRTRGCWHPARGLRASPAAAASPGWLRGLAGSGRGHGVGRRSRAEVRSGSLLRDVPGPRP